MGQVDLRRVARLYEADCRATEAAEHQVLVRRSVELPVWSRVVRDALAEDAAVPFEVRPLVRDAADSYRQVRWLTHEESERFCVLYLDGRNRVLTSSCISVGTLTASLVHPRELFRLAIAISAAAVVVAHNHPSGDPTPSAEDRALSERLRKAGELLGVRVLDHLVVGERGRFVSMAEAERW